MKFTRTACCYEYATTELLEAVDIASENATKLCLLFQRLRIVRREEWKHGRLHWERGCPRPQTAVENMLTPMRRLSALRYCGRGRPRSQY